MIEESQPGFRRIRNYLRCKGVLGYGEAVRLAHHTSPFRANHRSLGATKGERRCRVTPSRTGLCTTKLRL